MTATEPAKKPAQDPQGSQGGKETAPLKPVRPKIGESPGNLKKRGEAFARRHGKTR